MIQCPNCGGYTMHARDCDAYWQGVMAMYQNPITRTAIKLVPPIELHSRDECGAFDAWMAAYCKREWDTVSEYGLRNDPEVVDASGWREDHTAGV